MKLLASEQVQDWLRSLAPQTRRRVRLALRALEQEKGDILALRGELSGFLRLRIGGYRIIYSVLPGQVVRLEYADERDWVYERFRLLLDGSAGRR
jgi:mRNA-degrading endonuclease RelE of RelBE toxin-antitoxin system